MQNNDHQGEVPHSDEDSIAKILRFVGRRTNMPESTKAAWCQAFGDELALQRVKRRQRRQTVLSALAGCAALVLVGIFVVQAWQAHQLESMPIATVIQSLGETKGVDDENHILPLMGGKELAVGTTLRTGRNAYLSFELDSAQVRLNERTGVRLLEDRIQLLAGQLYVDSESSGLVISTPLAEISDIGTQFSVTYDARGVTTSVRDGSIVVALGEGEYRADASRDFAQKITVSKSSDVEITRSNKQGPDWDWSMKLASRFDIEGSTAYDFLQWVARETGLILEFENDSVEANARSTVLHGDIAAFDPYEAIAIVLATTRLSATQPDENTLRISIEAP